MKHAVWLHNRILNRLSGLTPLELLTKTKANHCDLLCTHVWGCPVYVLDQSYKMGRIFPSGIVGHIEAIFWVSVIHILLLWPMSVISLLVTQYHLVFDDLLEIMFSTGNDTLIDDICNHLFGSDPRNVFP